MTIARRPTAGTWTTGAEQHRTFADDIGRIVSGDYLPRDYTMALPRASLPEASAADLALHTRRPAPRGRRRPRQDRHRDRGVLSDPPLPPGPRGRPSRTSRSSVEGGARALPPRHQGARPQERARRTRSRSKRGARGQRDLFEGGRPDVLVSNYHKLPGWAEELAGKVEAIVFDECQELRHTDSMKYQAAERIAAGAKVRMGLSATPVFNMGGEVFNILRILRPGALGSKTEFSIEWLDTYGSRVKDPRALGSYLREAGLMLRRTRAGGGPRAPRADDRPAPHRGRLRGDQQDGRIGGRTGAAHPPAGRGGASTR
jgi:hypothetical protein